MYDIEVSKHFLKSKPFFFSGVDEVGRGPLAGPVVACSVSLHSLKFNLTELQSFFDFIKCLGINDSKKISLKKRIQIINSLIQNKILPEKIKQKKLYTWSFSENLSISIALTEVSEKEIDKINILNASLLAMRLSVLTTLNFEENNLVLVDGNFGFNIDNVAVMPVIKGDEKSLLIGLASIIAKNYRDHLMKCYAKNYPYYNWEKNSGYGTKEHLNGIKKYGITKHHRKSFKGVLTI